jgi:hypothetical protein
MPIEYGLVAAPSNTSAPDGSNAAILQGKAGEQIAAELHGKWYTAAYRNRVFIGSSLIAGVTIPVNTTTAPTFTLFNPLGSGVNLELITFDVGWPAAATTVIGTLLGSVSTQTPTAVTAGGTIISVPIGAGGVSQAKLYTAATIVAITTHIPLLGVTSTTDGMIASHYEFDGRLIIAPGGLITITSTPVQTGVAIPSFAWAEWPQ